MEMTNSRLSPGLRRAVVDLERYLRDLSEDKRPEKRIPRLSRVIPHRPESNRVLEDPLIPWLRVAMGALIVVAVGVGLIMIRQLSGLHL